MDSFTLSGENMLIIKKLWI